MDKYTLMKFLGLLEPNSEIGRFEQRDVITIDLTQRETKESYTKLHVFNNGLFMKKLTLPKQTN